MSYEELSLLSVKVFTERKLHDKNKDKDLAKIAKAKLLLVDTETQKRLDKLNLNDLYSQEVSKETTRANRGVRYYRYNKWHTTSLEEKARWGIDLIKMSLQGKKKPVVSCSFGIDSMVTLYMTRQALIELGRDPSEMQVVWNNTLNEFQEVREYAKLIEEEWGLKLLITKPKKPLKKIIDEHGGVDSSYFFTRKGDRTNGRPLSEKCCGTLKHEPMKRAIKENKWDLVINGLRSDESSQRLRAGLRDGEYFYSSAEWKAFVCRPIMWMKDEEIWDYVEQEKIPYNGLYDKNTVLNYPENNEEIIEKNKTRLESVGIDIQLLKDQQLLNFNKKQSFVLVDLGYKMFTPRTGCQMCPIPVKYGYLQFMRLNYPKVYNAMIYNLGYGKALLDMIPDEVKEEIELMLGIDLTEENAHEHMKDILESKPCVFDKF